MDVLGKLKELENLEKHSTNYSNASLVLSQLLAFVHSSMYAR